MKKNVTHYSHRIIRCFKRKSTTRQTGEVTDDTSNKRAIGDTAYDGAMYYRRLSDDEKRKVHKIKCPHIILSTQDIKKYNLPRYGTRTSDVTVFDLKVVLQNECQFGDEDRCTLCMESFNELPEDVDVDLLHSDRLGEFMVVKTPCRHYFHRDCLSGWIDFQNNKHRGYRFAEGLEASMSHFDNLAHILCPICKFDISNFKLICTNLGLPLSMVVIEQS